MKDEAKLRPIDLARDAGISPASVRFYEQEGFLPPARRAPSGHRRYCVHHLFALRVARTVIDGYGWDYARTVMRAVHASNPSAVARLVDARHAALHREREAVGGAIHALQVLATASTDGVERRVPGRVLHVAEVARNAGIPGSTVRFWEREGLIHPDRDPTSGYRRYGQAEVDRLRIIVILRNAGYGISQIRPLLEELDGGDPAKVLESAQKRAADLAAASVRCLRATAAVGEYLDRWGMLSTHYDAIPTNPAGGGHA